MMITSEETYVVIHQNGYHRKYTVAEAMVILGELQRAILESRNKSIHKHEQIIIDSTVTVEKLKSYNV